MNWIFVQDKRRFEGYSPDGRLIAVAPLEGADLTDLPSNVIRGTAPPELVEYAKRYLGGDAAAGDELAGSLADWNERFNQATVREQQRAGTQPAGGAGVLLPSPERINAELDIFQTAINLTDATEKLSQKEQALVREAQRLGIPIDVQSLYGSDTGVQGPFPATEAAISEVAATNPAYLAVLNRINNMAGVTELNRRQNVLAELEGKLQGAGEQRERNRTADDLQRALTRLERDYVAVGREIASYGKDPERELTKLAQDYQVKRQDLMDDLWIAMNEASPARAVAFFRDVLKDPGMSRFEGMDSALFGARDQFGVFSRPDPSKTFAMAQPTPPSASPTPAPPAVAPTAPPAPMVTSLGSPYAGVTPPAEKAPDEMTPEEREAWERRRREQERELSLPRFARGGSTWLGIQAPTTPNSSAFGSGGERPQGVSNAAAAGGQQADTMAPMPAWTGRQVQASLQGKARQIQSQQMERQMVREAFAREKASILNEFEQRKAAIAARWQAAVAQNPFISRVYNPQASTTTITPPAITYQPPAA